MFCGNCGSPILAGERFCGACGATIIAPPGPPQPPAYRQPGPQAPTAGPMPPDMHWVLVLVLSWITAGLVGLIWAFKEASFVKKIDPASKAVVMLLTSLLGMAAEVLLLILAATTRSLGPMALMPLLYIVTIVAGLVAIFGMRSSLVRYYDSVEPMGLRLSGVMTFFFNIMYFQYHFSRIAEWKKTGILR